MHLVMRHLLDELCYCYFIRKKQTNRTQHSINLCLPDLEQTVILTFVTS